jgi:hypothetical protein
MDIDEDLYDNGQIWLWKDVVLDRLLPEHNSSSDDD